MSFALAVGGMTMLAPTVLAGNSVSLTVPVATRSVTISAAAITMNHCEDSNGNIVSALVVPGGECFLVPQSAITVTNGPVSGHIDITGANAVPSDGGTPWTPGNALGTDTFEAFAYDSDSSFTIYKSPLLSTSPQCDTAFDQVQPASCAAAANQSQAEQLNIQAPSATTDTAASSFNTSVTWTAVP